MPALRAEPSKPTGFGRWFIVGLGVICGLIAGIILAFVVDNLDTRIFTVEQIGQITRCPLSGASLKFKAAKTEMLPWVSDSFIYNKDYLMLCARILTILQSGSVKMILVTSPNPKEGKSTFVSNIAMGLAKNKCKVLVIDADMRRPRQQKNYQVSGEQGLSSFLKMKTGKLKMSFKKT